MTDFSLVSAAEFLASAHCVGMAEAFVLAASTRSVSELAR